ncbi:MAG: hypothetical protein KF767_16735 [Bdellovibrionaceae bacterium]|nr:hypothetical protein [Pseudobdellovibrionaceae bacterium]
MKFIITALTLLGLGAPALAACTDHWGHTAHIRQIRDGVISLQFSTPNYPYSGHLKYSGERTRSYYFRGNGHTAEIEKTVASAGVGKIWYHYFDSTAGDHGQTRLATFTCR